MASRLRTALDTHMRPTVLIVDGDLGFVFWLGHTLDCEGCTAIPVKDAAAAAELIRQHGLAVDIVVIDGLLPEAACFIRSLRESRPLLRVIGVVPERWRGACPFGESDVLFHKPARLTENARRRWAAAIRKLTSATKAGNRVF